MANKEIIVPNNNPELVVLSMAPEGYCSFPIIAWRIVSDGNMLVYPILLNGENRLSTHDLLIYDNNTGALWCECQQISSSFLSSLPDVLKSIKKH
jgi:hypothetical protein